MEENGEIVKMGFLQKIKRILFKCEFAKDCPYYDPESYTCNEDITKDFCGQYKDRKYGPVIGRRSGD
jgi:hypothetical protein